MNTLHPNRALPPKELEERRLKAASYFKRGNTQYWVAKHFGVSKTAAREWYIRFKRGGTDAMLAQKPGNKGKLTERDKKALSVAILKGPTEFGYPTQLWTLSRVTEVARMVTKASYKPRSIWHTLYALGFSCQKPERRSKERDEKAITDWKMNKWPKLLKKGRAII